MKHFNTQKGFILIEALMAVLILGIVGLMALQALMLANKAVLLSDIRTTAESLSRTQMEEIKHVAYNNGYQAAVNGEAQYSKILDIPSGFYLFSEKYNGSTDKGAKIIAIAWTSSSGKQLNDTGLEKIVLYVYHGNSLETSKYILTLEGYVIK